MEICKIYEEIEEIRNSMKMDLLNMELDHSTSKTRQDEIKKEICELKSKMNKNCKYNNTMKKIEILMYQKDWNKLDKRHKIIKMNEFIDEKDIRENIKILLKKYYTDKINSGKFNNTKNGKKVEYNPQGMKIIDVMCFEKMTEDLSK